MWIFKRNITTDGWKQFSNLATVMTNDSMISIWASLVAQTVKNLPATQEIEVRFLGQEDPLEEGMATDSSILVRRIPWTEEPGGLQSMGLVLIILYICLALNFFLNVFFIFISWRLITWQYCSGFCPTLPWISHGFTCIPLTSIRSFHTHYLL